MELFVLGAGFSRSFVPEAPLLSKFLEGREELLDKDEFVAAKRFLDQCRFKASTANIETVMTLAAQHNRHAFEQLKILMVHVLETSFPKEVWKEGLDTMYRFSVKNGQVLTAFAQYLLKRSPRAHVISFCCGRWRGDLAVAELV